MYVVFVPVEQAVATPVPGAEVKKAVQSGLQILATGTRLYPEQRSCFSCHHQTLPMLAQITARDHGFPINEEILEQQTRLTHADFADRTDQLRAGTGIGGKSMTVSFALWALDVAGHRADDTTTAMVTYLLKTQKPDGRFYVSKTRPPLEDSPATSVTLAAYYLQKFASDAQRKQAASAVAVSRRWLLDYVPQSQEDRNSRLWGLHLFDGGKEALQAAQKAVLEAQRENGGWAQLPEMEPDAYATGQSLWVLQETGLPTDHPAYQRGLRFLLARQKQDGSWHVPTRSRPIQRYYESGFPHGVDQFISISATSWAVSALAASR